MKLQRRFAPTGGEFAPESVARFTGIRIILLLLPYRKRFPSTARLLEEVILLAGLKICT